MSPIKEISTRTGIAMLIAVVFVAIQRQELSWSCISIGLIHGFILGLFIALVVVAKKYYLDFLFRRMPLLLIILLNSILFLIVILIGRSLAMIITHGTNFRILDFDDPKFMGAILFIFGVMVFYNLLDQISNLTGRKQLFNFAIGKYSKAQMESRMILFLDMTDSTNIAEQIGDAKYLSLLGDFFTLMTNPLNESGGEIYKYIGDEAIITWRKNQMDAEVAVQFFFQFKIELEKQKGRFIKKYGVFPKFKGGLHYGSMMIGEIGSTKKEIALIGDTLNTTARILGIGKQQQQELMLSEILARQFAASGDTYHIEDLGMHTLKGKEETMHLFSIQQK